MLGDYFFFRQGKIFPHLIKNCSLAVSNPCFSAQGILGQSQLSCGYLRPVCIAFQIVQLIKVLFVWFCCVIFFPNRRNFGHKVGYQILTMSSDTFHRCGIVSFPAKL